jgi:hypothetical protein
MAIIAGARAYHQVSATVRAGFLPVMKVSWVTSPLCLAFAQKFLPEQTWVPFFNIIAFFIGTYINARTKKLRMAALRRKVRLPDQWLLYMLGTHHSSFVSYGSSVMSLGLSSVPLFWQWATADQSIRCRFVSVLSVSRNECLLA